MIEYFAFDVRGRRAGLLRRTLTDEGITASIETVKGGQWVDDPDALRYFVGVHGDQLDLVKLTFDEARAGAAELGVALGDELVSDEELRELSDNQIVALIVKRSSLDEERAREALSILRGGPPEGVMFDRIADGQ